MRRTLLAILLVFGLLLAPLALAAGGAPSGKGHDKAAEARAAGADDGDETDEPRAAHAAHRGGNATEHRPAWVATWHERLTSLLASMRENLTRVHEECRATRLDGDNVSREDRVAWAHCVRDGLREVREELRAMRDEARVERKEARAAVAEAGSG